MFTYITLIFAYILIRCSDVPVLWSYVLTPPFAYVILFDMNPTLCENSQVVKASSLPPLTAAICLESGSLEFREAVMRDQLESSPAAIAQLVEIELIKNAKRNAPWLIPTFL